MPTARVAYYRHGDHTLSYEALPLAEAVELVRSLKMPGNNMGWAPELLGEGWRAHLGEDKRTGRPRWSMRFQADGCFRSRECSIAEGCGVRYASHRAGYQASERAFAKFIARMVA
ncbi:hypothetical protein OKW76_00410 [Sphingomonas sp. S1-29]|uniref:hypothetical protein n=1 Tax=Sphingomonas sp. S1-29 TaxID=2991074 RepID=UPI00223F2C5D|nr:hypothetical protein [Sphingomonas sp. S1-29]UZK69587.1 hypothetical protein OKW76_00410 [Sphingomonas sp. S1-29]